MSWNVKHWEELVSYVLYRPPDSRVIFNFTCLDKIIQMLHDHNLVPGFEMMGNPSGYFTDLEDHSQIALFADLAFQLASRYIGLSHQLFLAFCCNTFCSSYLHTSTIQYNTI